MSKKLFSSLIGVILCVVLIVTMIPFAQGADITVTLVNPKAQIEAPKLIPLAERTRYSEELPLAGKRITFVGYSKDPGMNTVPSYTSNICDLLHEKYGRLGADNPTGVELIWTNQASFSDVLGEKGPFNYDSWVRGNGVDAVIAGVAN